MKDTEPATLCKRNPFIECPWWRPIKPKIRAPFTWKLHVIILQNTSEYLSKYNSQIHTCTYFHCQSSTSPVHPPKPVWSSCPPHLAMDHRPAAWLPVGRPSSTQAAHWPRALQGHDPHSRRPGLGRRPKVQARPQAWELACSEPWGRDALPECHPSHPPWFWGSWQDLKCETKRKHLESTRFSGRSCLWEVACHDCKQLQGTSWGL